MSGKQGIGVVELGVREESGLRGGFLIFWFACGLAAILVGWRSKNLRLMEHDPGDLKSRLGWDRPSWRRWQGLTEGGE